MSAAGESGLFVQDGLVIPDAEIEVRATRAGGPGGQNVNKVSTRIELHFDVEGSSVLSASQRRRIQSRLRTRISRAGVLRVVSQKHRTRTQNASAARERLAELLREALHVPRARRATRPTSGARKRRLDEKRRRADTKRQRRRPTDEH